jgi:glycosyltransferase involved in cell wall biosynthesis
VLTDIVFVNSTMSLGGGVKVIFTWANSLCKKGYNVELISNTSDPVIYERESNISLKILKVSKNIKWFSVSSVIKIFWILRRERPTTIIFSKGQYITPLFFLKMFHLIPKNIRLIYYVHGGSGNFKILYNNHRLYMLFKTFEKIICLYDDYAVTKPKKHSTGLRGFLNRIFTDQVDLEKCNYVPNPIMRKTVKITPLNVKRVVSAGRLVSLKQFDVLIRIFAGLSNKYPDWYLEIYGDGPERPVLQALIEELHIGDKVFLKGVVSDLQYKLGEGGIFASTSRHEGFGMVSLEAMSVGLPIISYSTKGARYLMVEGLTDFIIPQGDTELYRANLEALIKNVSLRESMSEASIKRAEQFNIEKLLPLFEQIIET